MVPSSAKVVRLITFAVCVHTRAIYHHRRSEAGTQTRGNFRPFPFPCGKNKNFPFSSRGSKRHSEENSIIERAHAKGEAGACNLRNFRHAFGVWYCHGCYIPIRNLRAPIIEFGASILVLKTHLIHSWMLLLFLPTFLVNKSILWDSRLINILPGNYYQRC